MPTILIQIIVASFLLTASALHLPFAGAHPLGIIVTAAPDKPSTSNLLNAKLPGVMYTRHARFAEPKNPPARGLARRGAGTPTTGPSIGEATSNSTGPTTWWVPVSNTTAAPTATEPSSGPSPTTTTGTGRLKYFGGPVIGSVDVTMLLWGTTPVPFASEFATYYAQVTRSAHFSMLSQYSTPTTRLTHGRFNRTLTLTPPSPPQQHLDNDADIVPFLRNLVRAGKLTPTADSYYPIHLPAGTSVTLSGQRSCVDFCGYHSTANVTDLVGGEGGGNGFVFYAVIPAQTDAGCAEGCGAQGTAFGNAALVVSHELVEAVTDPMVGVVGDGEDGVGLLGWYADDAAGGEIGDLCNGQAGKVEVVEVGADAGTENGRKAAEAAVVVVVVQREWSNAQGGCAVAGALNG
ncbi:hypothetical protein DFJ73DRAFT_755864 [Zopfochytrium polystomum]|nr:hypothetical protein DFJ73DRAFT_755864 [Zopfochytrium polystomum]